jgi:hypothetical protein
MRPIPKTESTCTLIDVNDFDDVKDPKMQIHHHVQEIQVTQETDLYLIHDGNYKTSLSLPSSSSTMSMNECLSCNPILTTRATEALSHRIHTYKPNPTQTLTLTQTHTPVIYVHQREVAHVSNEQYDKRGAVLASDAATTCHILALRSIHNQKILGSLCHLDSTKNEACIRKMVQEHIDYHDNISNDARVIMEVHIVGGYNDTKGNSSEITESVFCLLRDLASELKSTMEVQIKTCIVSGLNDSMTYSKSLLQPSPMVRGMAMDVASGHITLLQYVHSTLLGPEPTLRRVRLWSTSPNAGDLLTVHSPRGEQISIAEFTFHAFEDIDVFLSLPDDVLLEYSSTSPECEGENFCDELRAACRFVRDVKAEDCFFGRKSVVYDYVGKGCDWEKLG